MKNFVNQQNKKRILFTPGPGSLHKANLASLGPCFGRGDAFYESVETEVLRRLCEMSGHDKIARLQGSATLALEIAISNFVYGKVLVVNTGFYSQRLLDIVSQHMDLGDARSEVDMIDVDNLDSIHKSYDWVMACYTETSNATIISTDELYKLKKRTGASLLLDATGSIGLEDNHELADVIAYSSCKGLFGLTGASFIAFNEMPRSQPKSLYLSLDTHLNKMVTGPYHTIQSLYETLQIHGEIKASVIANKKRVLRDYKKYIVHSSNNQPLLCTAVSCSLVARDDNVVLYKSRAKNPGSIICHLGELHLGSSAKGDINALLEPCIGN